MTLCRTWCCAPAIHFILSHWSLVFPRARDKTLNFNVVQKGIPISNLQLLIDHKTEVNHIFHPWFCFVICLFLKKSRGRYKYKNIWYACAILCRPKTFNLSKQSILQHYNKISNTKDSFKWQPLFINIFFLCKKFMVVFSILLQYFRYFRYFRPLEYYWLVKSALLFLCTIQDLKWNGCLDIHQSVFFFYYFRLWKKQLQW